MDEKNVNKENESLNNFRYFTGKQILSIIREGDFAHAGETEAVELLISSLPNDILPMKNMNILDIGCGLGGTAEYIRKLGIGDVTGFDLEEEAINYAKEKYRQVDFFVCNVCNIGEKLKSSFDFMYMFNVFYAFRDQETSLSCLRKLAKRNCILATFDYTNNCTERPEKNRMYRGKEEKSPFIPINMKEIEKMMGKTGWKIVKILDVTEKYEEWYVTLLQKLESKKEVIISKFNECSFDRAKERYTQLLSSIQTKETGGVIIYSVPV